MEIQISKETYAKIMHWINKSTDEVSGFGKVTYYKDTGVFQVHDAYLLKQTNGASHTDIDGASLSKLMYTTRLAPGELKWWWHSHVNMPVFWSGTDTATIAELGSQGWIAATVFNKRNEMRSALAYNATTPFGDLFELKDEVATHIIDPNVTAEAMKAWDAEYESNVEKKTYAPVTHTPTTYSGYGAEDYSGYKGWRAQKDQEAPEGQAATLVQDKKILSIAQAKDRQAERLDYMQNGYYGGYGAAAEAKVLGIALPKYLDILCDGDRNQLNKIDGDLQMAVEQGLLV